MTTAKDIIQLALVDAGVTGQGQTPSAEDITNGFRRMNYMLAQWQRKRWLVWALTEATKVSTGAASYTVGPGQDFDIPRPDKLEDGNFLRQITQPTPGQVDYPLELINSKEDYNRLPLKGLTSFQRYVYYDPQFPIGIIRPYPVPNANIYEIHILVKAQLSQFATVNSEVILPPEYLAALHYNLSARLMIAYKMPLDPGVVALAEDALAVLRMANVQIPRLRIPAEVTRVGVYNVFSDSVR